MPTRRKPRKRTRNSTPTRHGAYMDSGARFYLQRERLNAGGYTSSGQYFGSGAPLFHYYDENGDIDDHVRASDRQRAMAKIRERHPSARFFGERKAAKNSTQRKYAVLVWDPEGGFWRRRATATGASSAEVTRRFAAKWGIDEDDVKVDRAAAKKSAKNSRPKRRATKCAPRKPSKRRPRR